MPHRSSRSLLVLLLLAAAGTVYIGPAMAADAPQEMAWGTMAMNLFGGLAIFLFGMDQMAEALKAVAGERMKIILARLTTNRFMGALTGAFVTAVIQSSSVTTVLVVGFITAGLMSLAQSIGVIMGANIGTTITAQIVAFKVTKAALLMVAVGFGMMFFSPRERIRQYGAMLMGLGLVFFGMAVMSNGMKPLRSYQPFLDLMVTMESPLVGILIAAAFTGLIQSSSATTGIVIVMATQGFITLPAGIALAFGANIGTCVTALLASIGKPREAVRAAVVHILFNVAGVLLWLGLIDELATFVTSISPKAEGLSGTERLAAEAPRQIANAHTVFNIANTFIFIWFTAPTARLVEWLVPDKPLDEKLIIRPKYLAPELLTTPTLALERARLELGHMGEVVKRMLREMLPAVMVGDRAAIRDVAKMDDEVDILYGEIVSFLGEVSRKPLDDRQMRLFMELMDAVKSLENIGDIIETDLMALGQKRLDEDVTVSSQTRQVLAHLHEEVAGSVAAAIDAVAEDDQRKAQQVIAAKLDINRLVEEAERHQEQRLIAEEPGRLKAYAIEVDIIEKLKRIYYFAKRIAKAVVPTEVLERSA